MGRRPTGCATSVRCSARAPQPVGDGVEPRASERVAELLAVPPRLPVPRPRGRGRLLAPTPRQHILHRGRSRASSAAAGKARPAVGHGDDLPTARCDKVRPRPSRPEYRQPWAHSERIGDTLARSRLGAIPNQITGHERCIAPWFRNPLVVATPRPAFWRLATERTNAPGGCVVGDERKHVGKSRQFASSPDVPVRLDWSRAGCLTPPEGTPRAQIQ
jgi:hypothetical protein